MRVSKSNKIHCTKKFSKLLRFLFISVPVVVFREHLNPRIKADIWFLGGYIINLLYNQQAHSPLWIIPNDALINGHSALKRC